jgi:hypothetical protein
LQDLPFAYRFGSLIAGAEQRLTSGFQTSNTLRDVTLPSNPSITAVVYVRDVLGGEARATVSSDRVTDMVVACSPLAAADVAAVVAASLDSLVQGALAQGNAGASLAAIGNIAQVREVQTIGAYLPLPKHAQELSLAHTSMHKEAPSTLRSPRHPSLPSSIRLAHSAFLNMVMGRI